MNVVSNGICGVNMVKIIRERDYVVEINQKNPTTVVIKYNDLVIKVNPWDLLEQLLDASETDVLMDRLGEIQSEFFAELGHV